MSKMKPEKSRIKSDILLRVRLLYILFILAGLLIFARLVWVQLFSSEVAYNAERLAGRIFTEQIIPAQRGNILTRDGDPLATSIFRYRVEFDFGSPGLDSVRTFHEQSDSLSKLLAAYFGDRSAAEYRRMFRTQHAKHYQVKYRKDTLVPRSEGHIARWIDRILDREFVPKKLYDTLRDHTPVQIFPRDIDYTEWETLRKYPLLNWNMGMVYNLRESDERIYPQGELGRRTIGLTGDRGNYGIEAVYREELAGRDGRATRQRIARGFYGRVVDGDNIDPIDGLDVVTTLDLDVQDVANRYLREQLEAQNAIWGTTIVMEVRTGEILALVNLGRTPGGGYAERENYAIGRNTEPGSTFKLASMLLLLDDADMPLDQTYDTGNGRVVKVGGIRVQDSHAGFNDMDFRTAVAQSSNVYFAKAIWERYADNKERYSDFMKKLHLDQTVGLEAFGEKKPLFQDWKEVPDPNSMLVRRSFGYRIKLSPIQVITLYNAIANDGKMISPILVRELRRDGDVVKHFKPRLSWIKSAPNVRCVRSANFSKASARRYGCWIFPRHDPLHRSGQDRYGPIRRRQNRLPRRLLHRQHGRLLPGSQPSLHGAHDDPHQAAGRQILLRRPALGSGGQESRHLPLQPGARLGSLAGKFRGKTLSPANQRRRHRPDPPHRRQILAPHLVRRPQRLGNGTDRLPLERHDLDARTGRPNDAQRRRHGTQRRPVPARKPGPQSFLLGTRLRPIPKHRSRHADLARGSRNHNTQIKR